MGTSNPNYKSTHDLLRGLRGLISTVIIGAISARAEYISSQLEWRPSFIQCKVCMYETSATAP